MTAAKAKAKTRHPMEINAAGNPLKVDFESITGLVVGVIPWEPGNPPGASG